MIDNIFPVRKKRVIHLNRTIDLELYNSLFPKICELREKSDDPIYIYLDSRGGNVSLSEKLHELLRAPRYDGASCKIVTIVPQLAASAAADLAILGDFCSVYPAAVIHCHGTRLSTPELTVGNVDDIGTHLRISNKSHALKLAQKVSERLAFRIWLNQNELLEYSEGSLEKTPSAEKGEELIHLQDLTSTYFAFLLNESKGPGVLSPTGLKFVQRCVDRWGRKREMVALVTDHAAEAKSKDHHKDVAEKLMDRVIEEVPDGTSSLEIARRVVDDATLLGETFPGITSWDDLATKQGAYFLKPEDENTFESLEDNEREQFLIRKTRDKVMLNYLIATNLCQTLHESENPFSAIDAYHLGLVDEVYGMTHIYPSIRSIFEASPGAGK